jgi:hypothetical protein
LTLAVAAATLVSTGFWVLLRPRFRPAAPRPPSVDAGGARLASLVLSLMLPSVAEDMLPLLGLDRLRTKSLYGSMMEVLSGRLLGFFILDSSQCKWQVASGKWQDGRLFVSAQQSEIFVGSTKQDRSRTIYLTLD